MTDSDKHIDELFKKLENDSFSVPQSFVDDLNMRLDAESTQNKRKKPFFWLFFGLSMFTIVGVFASYYIFLDQRDLRAAQSKAQSSLTTRNSETTNASNSNVTEESNEREKTESIMSLNKSTVSSDIESMEMHHIVLVQKAEESNRVRTNLNGLKLTSSSISGDDPVDFTIDDTNNHSKDPISSEMNDQRTLNDKFGIEVRMKTRSVQFTERDLQIVMQNQPVEDSISKAKPDSKPWQFDIQLYGGISQEFWKDKPDIASFDRTPAWSPNIGLKGNIFYNNLNASLGVEFYQSNEKLATPTTVLEQVGIDSTFLGFQYDTVYTDSLSWYIDSTEYFQINPIHDSVEVQQQIKNTYSWLSIPISFGYRFKINSWSIIPRAGLNLNFGISTNRGSYPGPNFVSNEFNAVRFNLDLMIQTEIRKDFTNFHLFLTPYYRGNLTPMLKSQEFNLTRQSWGVNVGVGYTF